MNPIGILQGRLSPPVGGRIQAFPVETWRDEFAQAREAGLASIEWIYETGTDGVNPLGTDAGIAEMQRLAAGSGVGVWSVCADYYMTEHLVAPSGAPVERNVQRLEWLLGRSGRLGARYIVLPFVDSSSLKSSVEILGLLQVLRIVTPFAEQAGVELHLETDLPPRDLEALLKEISHPLVRANYDIGNSASLGHNPAEELTLLGPWLGSAHVKDRVPGGSTVPLGTGVAHFPTCFHLICAAGFRGPYILQTAREEGPSEVELAIRNRHFVEKHIAAAANKGQ